MNKSKSQTNTYVSSRPLYRSKEHMPRKLIMTDDDYTESTETMEISQREFKTMIETDRHEKQELEKRIVNVNVALKESDHKQKRYKEAADRLKTKLVAAAEENKVHRSKCSKKFNIAMMNKDKKPTDLAKLTDDKFKRMQKDLDEFDKQIFDNYDF